MTPGFALVLLAVVVLIGALLRLQQGATLARIGQWASLATRYRLTFHSEKDPFRSTIDGIYLGVPVRISLGTSRVGLPLPVSTRLSALLKGGAPVGLEILPRWILSGSRPGELQDEVALGAEPLDRALRVRGRDRTRVLQVVNDPTVSAALLLALQRADYLRVTDQSVELDRRGIIGPELGDLLEIAGMLSTAIGESGDRPWKAAAARFSLGYSGTTPSGTRCMQGAVDNIKILVLESPAGPGRSPQTRVQMFIPFRPASTLRILQRLEVLAAAGPTPTDSQIGDSLAVDCKDGEFVTLLLGEPEVVKRLTSHYRKWPGSRIEAGRVQIIRDGMLGMEIIEIITQVLDFCRFFRDAMVEVDEARKALHAELK